MTRIPDLFIVGAPKSGTTSLYEWLKGHPEIYMTPVKEPNYFAPDLGGARNSALVGNEGLGEYLELFADAGEATRLGEASVRYLYSKEAPALIHDVQPAPFIVAVLRNPVDMAYSLYSHMVAGGSEELTDFAQALDAEEDRHAGNRVPTKMNPQLSTYRDRARYGEQLQRWMKVFGRDRVHVIVFEELIENPARGFRTLLEFLDVDPAYQPEEFAAFNVAHASRSTILRRALNMRAPQWVVWTLLPRMIGARRARELVQSFRHSRFHRRRSDRAPISAELRRRLEKEFEPDVATLSSLFGRDFGSIWFGRASRAPAHTPGVLAPS